MCRRDKPGSAGRHPLRPARDGGDTGARDLDQAERQHQLDELVDLVALAGDLEYEAFGGGVDHPGAEGVRQPQRLDPVLALALDLDHGELALDRAASERHVHDAVHRHQAVELVLDLLDHHRRAGGDRGDQRQMLGVLGLRHRQRLDIIAAAGDQAEYAREHAGLVVDQHRERMALRLLRRRRRRIVACRGSVHDIRPYRRRIPKAQSRPRPRASARSIHSMACASKRRALRSGPASTTSKPSWPTRSITFGLFAASSPATNITDFTPFKTGFAILPKPVVLSVLNTEAPAAQPWTFSPAEMLCPISRLMPSGPRVSGLVESSRIFPFRPPMARIAACAAGHGVDNTMMSAKAAASAAVPARAFAPIARSSACVLSAFGSRTPEQISRPAFCAPAGPGAAPTLPAQMMASFIRPSLCLVR